MLDDDIQSKERKRLRREKVIRKFIGIFLIIMINVFTNQVVFFLLAGYKYVVII